MAGKRTAGGEVVSAGVALPAMKAVGGEGAGPNEDTAGTAGAAGLRYRHDGWTPRRQAQFVEVLARTGCIKDACRVVRISKTSLYRARERLPDFDQRCQAALEEARPSLEEVAYNRAVHGWKEEVYQGGKLVGYKTRFSETILKTLISRKEGAGAVPAVVPPEEAVRDGRRHGRRLNDEEVLAEILKRLAAINAHRQREERAEQLAWCVEMEKKGLAP